jgi:hypothetical protein
MKRKIFNLLKLLKKINGSFFILFGFIVGIIGTLFSIIIWIEFKNVIKAYAFIIVFFMIVLNMIDVLNNYYVPLLIGTADMYLNVLNFWLFIVLYILQKIKIMKKNKYKCES